MMTLLASFLILPFPVQESEAAFEARTRKLFSMYREFRAPVDQRPGWVVGDPVGRERQRRDMVMLQAAKRFDPKGFDRWMPDLENQYRKEFLGGIQLRIEGKRQNDSVKQSKGSTMMGDFVNLIRGLHPQALPTNYDTPINIPKVWRPAKNS